MASTLIKKTSHTFEFVLFLILCMVVRIVPFQYLHVIAEKLIFGSRWLLKNRWETAYRNLRNAFPEKSNEELHALAEQSFISIATAFLEFLCFPELSPVEMRKAIRITNPEILNELLKKNKGLILVSAHYGNWEFAAQGIALTLTVPTYIIVKGQSNEYIDLMINRWREQFGAKTVPMGVSIREILRALQHGEVVQMASDQAAAKESVAVEFFGREVPTFQGPAVFALRTGAPLIVGLAVRQNNGTYTLHCHRIDSDDLHGVSDETVRELTRRQVAKTEELIREHPEQWMWMHKRWKHVPDRI